MAKDASDRIFNPHGRRHYRRTYSVVEVRVGLVVLALLAAIAVWVVVRGQHPDPALFDNGAAMLDPGAGDGTAAGDGDRGALPEGLVVEGYREGPISHFGSDNLFEKINGRADFFKSRGFVQLTFVSLQHEDPNRSVDIELYDMGSTQNALGTYASERAPEVRPERRDGGLFHREDSALFVVRGKHYLRALAASGAAPVPAQLDHLLSVLSEGLEGGERPWSEALFVDGLSLPAEAVGFVRENAFSFGFARGVHTGRLADGETELFVVPCDDGDAAAALARRFIDGFSSYGEATERDGQVFVEDRYLKRVSTAAAAGAFALGVVAAADADTAAGWLARLREALKALPEDLRARALSEAGSRVDNGVDNRVDNGVDHKPAAAAAAGDRSDHPPEAAETESEYE